MFIENVNILSTVGPNAERNLANFTKMEFEVHEPYGITLIEKVRAATALNGFQDYQDAPLLLTIEFKGFDEQARPLSGIQQAPTYGWHIRKIPILIARVDFDVNEGGAKYQVIAVPYTDLVFDDRFKFPRTKLPIASNNAEQWAIDVAAHLDRQMDQEVAEKKRELKDTYIFKIDPEVTKNGGVYQSQSDTIHQPSTAAQHQQLLRMLEELAGGTTSEQQAPQRHNTATLPVLRRGRQFHCTDQVLRGRCEAVVRIHQPGTEFLGRLPHTASATTCRPRIRKAYVRYWRARSSQRIWPRIHSCHGSRSRPLCRRTKNLTT